MRNLSWGLCFVLIGCGGQDVEGETGDTGQVLIDTGQAAVDSGIVVLDTGIIPQDDAGGGSGSSDVGAVPSDDAGSRPDVGGPPPRPDIGGPRPQPDAGGGGGGGSSCIEVMECSMQCRDQACLDRCVDRAQPGPHRRAAQAMMQCSADHDCINSGSWQQCMMRNCMRHAESCGGQGGGPPPGPGGGDAGPGPLPDGDGGFPPQPDMDAGGGGPHNGRDRSCSEALVCAERCGQNMRCMQGCFGGLGQSSQRFVDAIFSCMGQNNCGMDFGCAARSCPRQIQACRNDR